MSRSPRYKGTTPFQDADLDRQTFCGRSHESRLLLNHVLGEDLVVLFAKSGMGKTSIVNASLMKSLRERDFFPIVARLGHRSQKPRDAIFEGISLAAEQSRVECVGGDHTSVWHFFKSVEFWSDTNDLLRPVLILDQFEELFTMHAPAARREFATELSSLVRGRLDVRGTRDDAFDSGAPELKILLSLREDYVANLEELTSEVPGILRNRYRLGPLSRSGAREAIVGPAQLESDAFDTQPFSFREEAVDKIIAFLGKERFGDELKEVDEVEPVQLQLICQSLEELVRSGHASRNGQTEISEQDLGGEAHMKQVMSKFYDRVIGRVPGPEKKRVTKLCETRLISPLGRRLMMEEQVIEQELAIPPSRLQSLVDERLLRAEPHLGSVHYELSHDRLVEPIRATAKEREARKRRVLIPALAALLIAVVFGVAFGLPYFLRQRELKLIDEYIQWLPSDGKPASFGEVSFELVDVGRRVATLSGRIPDVRREKLREFVEQNKEPPPWSLDDEINKRILLEGGEFLMGSPDGGADESPPRTVRVSPFFIQQHEVTNREYKRFARDHGADDDRPATVSWSEAMGYAAWLGGALPTEAQWEYTAKGGATDRPYPWGSAPPTEDHANYGDDAVTLEDVMSFPAGATPDTDVHDLAGNVWEWCLDYYGPYPASEDDAADPPGPRRGDLRVMRGGSSVSSSSKDLRSAARSSFYSDGAIDIGFRVVWPQDAFPE